MVKMLARGWYRLGSSRLPAVIDATSDLLSDLPKTGEPHSEQNPTQLGPVAAYMVRVIQQRADLDQLLAPGMRDP